MESSSEKRGAFFPFFIYFSETEFGAPILSYDPTRRPRRTRAPHIEQPMSPDERSDDDLVASKLRHLQAQVTSLEAACSTRVDVLTRECDALRTENEALRTEVAALRDVDRTLLEGLLDDLAPIDTRGDEDHAAADEARLEADRAMARALSLATTRVQPSRAAKRLKVTEQVFESEPDSDSDSDGPLGVEVRDEGNKASKGDDALRTVRTCRRGARAQDVRGGRQGATVSPLQTRVEESVVPRVPAGATQEKGNPE
jgi:hypothetical protein